MTRWTVALVLASLIASTAMANELEPLAWLEGTWVRETSRSTRYERWQVLSPNTMEGDSWSIAKPDGARRHIESMLLASMSSEIFYIPKVAENPLPVAFKLTGITDTTATFENPEHDFPTKIVYMRVDASAMTVSVEGAANDGEPQRIEFHFTRHD